MLVFAVFVVVLIGLLLAKIRSLECYWRSAGIPHKSYLSYLYCHYVRCKREVVYDVMCEYSRRYGPVYGTYQGLKPLLRVTSVEGAKDALIRNFSSVPRRGFDVATGVPIWDSSLNALPYDQWKLIRQVSGVGFTTNKLRGLVGTIEGLSLRLTDQILSVARTTGKLDPSKHVFGYVLDLIAAVVYGLELHAMADPRNPFVEHAKGIFAPGLNMFLLMTAPTLLKYLPFVQFPNKKTTDFFDKFASAIIKQRRQRCAAISKSEFDILDVWLREQETNPAFTDDIIISQTFLFFIAGLDTMSYTLTLALYFLATHPEAGERAFSEINSLVLDGNTNFDDFQKLKFVEACVLETLRLCPTDFVIDRVCSAPCTVAGVSVRPGMAIQVAIPAIHRDPAYFPEPDSFRPERFLDGSSTLDAYMAFGDGLKNCIGKRLVLLQLTVTLSCILKKVKLGRCPETPKELRFDEGHLFIPTSKQPLIIAVEERDKTP